MKALIILITFLIAPNFALAQDLAAQKAQAQQVAANNGTANPADIAAQLAEAFGSQQNAQALLTKAKQLASASPSEAKAIAAAAAVFNSAGAAEIAAELAKINPSQAAAIAAAVAAVVPASAPAIAAAVAAAVPAQAAAIQTAVSQAVPGQASAIASALAGLFESSTTTGFPSTTQFTSQNPANLNAGETTPTPTPTPRPSPSPKPASPSA